MCVCVCVCVCDVCVCVCVMCAIRRNVPAYWPSMLVCVRGDGGRV